VAGCKVITVIGNPILEVGHSNEVIHENVAATGCVKFKMAASKRAKLLSQTVHKIATTFQRQSATPMF